MKLLKNLVFVFLVLIFSLNSFASIDTQPQVKPEQRPEQINKCLDLGVSKVLEEALAMGCEIDGAQEIKVQKVKSQWYNPNKYVWYQVTGFCDGNYQEIVELVQYNVISGKCL